MWVNHTEIRCQISAVAGVVELAGALHYYPLSDLFVRFAEYGPVKHGPCNRHTGVDNDAKSSKQSTYTEGGEMCTEHLEWSHEARSEAKSMAIDRRAFLKLSGAGLACIALLGSFSSARVLAQEEPSQESSLVVEFRDAAEEYDVPVELLMSMGWVNTRWEMPPPQANDYKKGDLHGWGSYGIMALVKNPYSDTLGAASRLTGIPEEKLKRDRAANIRGGAALLAASAGAEKPSHPEGFFGAVAGRGITAAKNYRAVAGIGGGELYADEVFEILEKGASRKIRSGAKISLAAHGSARGGRGE